MMTMYNPQPSQAVPSAAYRLLSKMEVGKENVIVYCNSDSTGITSDYDGSTYYNKWIYKIASYLASKYPAYTVQYYDVVPAFYNLVQTLQVGNKKCSVASISSGGAGYAAGDNIYIAGGVTLSVNSVSSGVVTSVSITAAGSISASAIGTNPVHQIGTSANGLGATFNLTWIQGVTLYFYNAAFAGTQPTYLMGNRLQAVFNVQSNADLIIFNHGHNTDSNASANVQQGMNMAAIYTMLGFHPSAGVLCVSQNPIRDDDTGTNRSAGGRQTAIAGGFGLLDVNQMFMKSGKPNSWYRIVPSTGKYDTIHPGIIGDQKIYELARPMFQWPVVPLSQKSGLTFGQNILLNGDFQTWTNLSLAPDNWASTNLTLSKNTVSGQFERGAYSLQLTTTTTSGGYLQQSLPANLVRMLAGRFITLAARVYVPAGNTLSTAARMNILEVDNSTPYGIPTGGRDGFIWKAVVIQIPSTATAITVQILADAVGSSSGTVCTFDRIIMCAGNLPLDAY